jgi:hypothetical protein
MANRNESMSMPYRGKVSVAHQASYPDPIAFHIDDEVDVTDKEENWHGWIWIWCINQQGKAGWVPSAYIVRQDGSNKGVALCDYDARELSVAVGEEVSVQKAESGWLWCINQQGQSGWVPAENIHAVIG